MKILFFIILILVILLILFLFACLKVSSECSREEERRDFYKVIRTDIEREENREKPINKKII